MWEDWLFFKELKFVVVLSACLSPLKMCVCRDSHILGGIAASGRCCASLVIRAWVLAPFSLPQESDAASGPKYGYIDWLWDNRAKVRKNCWLWAVLHLLCLHQSLWTNSACHHGVNRLICGLRVYGLPIYLSNTYQARVIWLWDSGSRDLSVAPDIYLTLLSMLQYSLTVKSKLRIKQLYFRKIW